MSDPIFEHLLGFLGVTAVELLPVHHVAHERGWLMEQGLINYWGYSSIGYFAPSAGSVLRAEGYQHGEHVAEFKSMVRKFHDAGIEVILDVVYNQHRRR